MWRIELKRMQWIVEALRPSWVMALVAAQVAGIVPGWGQEIVLPSLDPSKRITQYVFETWTTEDGLPSNQIRGITQTRDGYLWLATLGGLVRFDGVSFHVPKVEDTPTVRAENFGPLVEGPDGSLWIGSAGAGLFRYREGRFTRYTVEGGLGNSVSVLLIDRSGVLWVGSQGGLFRLEQDTLVRIPLPGLEPIAVKALSEDAAGTIWIGTLNQENNLFQVRGDGVVAAAETLHGLDAVNVLLHDAAGALWIGASRGLYRLEGETVSIFAPDPNPDANIVRSLYQDRGGHIWFGTDAGLNRIKDGVVESFTVADGLPDGRSRSIYEDREGNLWLGAYAGGLSRLKDGPVTPYTTGEGLVDDMVWAVAEDRERNLWVGSRGGLNRLTSEADAVLAPPDGFPTSVVYSTAFDTAGNLWAGTNIGLIRSTQTGFRRYTTGDSFLNHRVKVVYEDPDAPGTLWVGTPNGLARYRDGALMPHGSISDTVFSILRDRIGNLWIGTEAGLRQIRDSVVTTYTTADGLSSNSLRTLYEDAAGTLWAGTSGGGLVRYSNGHFSSYTTHDGLLANDVWGIVEDDDENLWLSSDNGIQRIAKHDLDAYDTGLLASLPARSYGLADGMKSTECNGQGSPMGWKSADGMLWFPTMGGVVRIDPKRTETGRIRPPVVIESLLVGESPVDLRADIELEPGRRDLEIRYTALSFRNSHRLQFRYRLGNFDDHWQEVGARRSAFYTNLPPGSYTFRVQASAGEGVWSETGASLDFSLTPHLFERAWFQALCVLLAGSLAYTGYRYRTERIRSRSEHFETINELLETANRELENKNAELERYAYTVSHDLKNPLQTILGFTGSLKNDLARGATERVQGDLGRVETAARTMYRLLDELLELSRIGRVINPSESIRLTELAGEAVALLHGVIHERAVEVEIAPDLPRIWGDRIRLLEVFSNLIENAIKFMGDQSSPRVEIGMRQHEEEIICFVRDNGIGIAPEYQEKVFGLFDRLDLSIEGTGIGLALVKRVVELHGGRVWVESAGTPRGSTFCFTLPQSSHRSSI